MSLRNCEGLLHAGKCADHICSYIKTIHADSSIIAVFLYNLASGRHYLTDISDDGVVDCPDEVRQIFIDMLSSASAKYQSKLQKFKSDTKLAEVRKNGPYQGLSQKIREVLSVLLTDRKSTQSTYKDEYVGRAHLLKRKYGKIIIPGLRFSRREIYRNGASTALSNLALELQWPDRLAAFKEKRDNFLSQNVEYANYRCDVYALERIISSKFRRKVILTPRLWENEEIQAIANEHPNLSCMIDGNLLSQHLAFRKMHPPTKHKLNFNTGIPFLEINKDFNVEIIDSNKDHVKGLIQFKIQSLSTLPPLKFTLRSLDVSKDMIHLGKRIESDDFDSVKMQGLKIYPSEGESLKIGIGVSQNAPKFKKRDESRILYVDLGWHGPTSARCSGKTYRLGNIFNLAGYERVLESHCGRWKKLSSGERDKLSRIKDSSQKEAVARIVTLARDLRCKWIVIEKMSRSVNLRRRARSRKEERRINYLKNLIGGMRFSSVLDNSAARFGIKVQHLSSFAPERKVYSHSNTCIRCNKVGLRFSVDGKKVRGCRVGKFFVCSCGYVTQDDDDMALKNMERHIKGVLPSFSPGIIQRVKSKSEESIKQVLLDYLDRLA